ncbi:hypothetical protein [Bythopirellula polymerisocia]|uniref:hypothetical protein n=1 Tax=Bythopirellula polymerisocia TaxID=2528003 RepID=UPI0011B5F134|nr:hypothetical protein [Bythopirellula polymerisocia]
MKLPSGERSGGDSCEAEQADEPWLSDALLEWVFGSTWRVKNSLMRDTFNKLPLSGFRFGGVTFDDCTPTSRPWSRGKPTSVESTSCSSRISKLPEDVPSDVT